MGERRPAGQRSGASRRDLGFEAGLRLAQAETFTAQYSGTSHVNEGSDEKESRISKQPEPPDLAAIKEHVSKKHSLRETTGSPTNLLLIAELLCEAVDLRPGRQVLGAATVDRNTASYTLSNTGFLDLTLLDVSGCCCGLL